MAQGLTKARLPIGFLTQAFIIQIAPWKLPAAAAEVTVATAKTSTNLTNYVTPRRVYYFSGTCKAWICASVAANVPTLDANYNVTSLTDTATGNVQVNFTTSTFGTSYGVNCGGRRINTTYTVANTRKVKVRNGGMGTTALNLDCVDDTATTNLAKDPDCWYAGVFSEATAA